MKIKTYPVQYTETEWQEIKTYAFNQKKSLKQFIDEAIKAKIQEVKNEQFNNK